MLRGRCLPRLVPSPLKPVLVVPLASSVHRDQASALTVDLDTILTGQWPALHVLLELSLPALALQASMIALNVGLGLMLLEEHLFVLYVMLEGMLNHLDRAAVFLVLLATFQQCPVQHLISVKCVPNLPLHRRGRAHARTVQQDVTRLQKALAQAQIA